MVINRMKENFWGDEKAYDINCGSDYTDVYWCPNSKVVNINYVQFLCHSYLKYLKIKEFFKKERIVSLQTSRVSSNIC